MYEPSPELKKLEAEKAEAEQQLMREQHKYQRLCNREQYYNKERTHRESAPPDHPQRGCRECVSAGEGVGRGRIFLPCRAHLLHAGGQRHGDGGGQRPQRRRSVGR